MTEIQGSDQQINEGNSLTMQIIQCDDGYGDYVLVPLTTKGKFTLVSPEDFDFVSKWGWFLKSPGYVHRTKNKNTPTSRSVLLHREILIHCGYNLEGINVDHRNGVKHDNRRGNLRPATHGQNSQNKHGSWGQIEYRGVTIDGNSSNPYRTRIKINDDAIEVGRFPEIEQAAIAYDLAALEIYEYIDQSALNFPGNPLYQETTLREFKNKYGYIPQSEYRGVDLDKARGRRTDGYRARIKLEGTKELSYQVFMDELDAAKCVDLMEIERSGVNAIPLLNLNVSEYPGLEDNNYRGITALEFWKQRSHKYVKYKNVYPINKKPDSSYYGRLGKAGNDYRTIAFRKEEDAARAVDELRIKLHGDKAIKYLNFPVEDYLHIKMEYVPSGLYRPDWV